MEARRPDLDQHLWHLFTIYYLLCARCSWKVREGWDRQLLRGWQLDTNGKPDEGLINPLREVLSDEQVDTALRLSSDSSGRLGVLQQVLVAIREELLHSIQAVKGITTARPTVSLSGTIPIIEGPGIDWQQEGWQITLHNHGTVSANALGALLLGPGPREREQPPSLSDRFYLRRQPDLLAGQQRAVSLHQGGLVLSGNTIIGLRTLFAPPIPTVPQLLAGTPPVLGRLTLSYQGRDTKRKYVDLFDYYAADGWRPVQAFADFPQDLYDLDRQARKLYQQAL
jgi:hypothetical protein